MAKYIIIAVSLLLVVMVTTANFFYGFCMADGTLYYENEIRSKFYSYYKSRFEKEAHVKIPDHCEQKVDADAFCVIFKEGFSLWRVRIMHRVSPSHHIDKEYFVDSCGNLRGTGRDYNPPSVI